MIFTKIRDLKYVREDRCLIDLFATCNEYGEIPMTLNLMDTEDIHIFIDIDDKEYPLEAYCLTQQIQEYIEPEPTIVIPQSISPRQIRAILNKLNKRVQVEALIDESNDYDLKDWWEYSTEYRRDNEILIFFAKNSLGMTDTGIDDFFIEANKL